MTDDAAALTALLVEAGKAHHQAFMETDGEDPEWPLWYAGYLRERLEPVLGTVPTRSELVFHLLTAERRHGTDEPSAPWSDYYARYLLAELT